MELGALFHKMLLLFIYIAIGFVAGKAKIIDELTVQKMNRVLLFVGQPAIVISSVLGTELVMDARQVLVLFLLALLLHILLLMIGLIFTPLYFQQGKNKGLYRFMTMFGNVVFMGYPVIQALYGDDAIFLAAICSIPFNLLVFSVGVMLIKGNAKGTKIDFSFLKSPAFVSIIIAIFLFFSKIQLPGIVMEAASGLGSMLIPLSMVIIGANISMSSFKLIFTDWKMFILCGVKLVIAPILIYLLCGLFIKNEIFLGIIVVSAAMPVAVLAPVLSTEHGGDVNVASRGVFVSTLLSLVTIPFIVFLLF